MDWKGRLYLVCGVGILFFVLGSYTAQMQYDETYTNSIKKEVYIKEYGVLNGDKVFKCRSMNGTLLVNGTQTACVIKGNDL